MTAEPTLDGVRQEVQDRLDLVDRITRQGDPETLLPLARAELHRLAESWRQLLAAHQPDEDGRCQTCPPGIRRRRWPCQVWFTAHDQLIGGALPTRASAPAPATTGQPVTADEPAPQPSGSRWAEDAATLPVIQRVEVTGEQPAATAPPTLNELTLPPRTSPIPASEPEPDGGRIHRAAVVGRPPRLPLRPLHRHS